MIFDRIASNPARMNGQPCVRDLRLTVRRVVEAVATYPNREELRREYPELDDEDIRQALLYAATCRNDRIMDLSSHHEKLLLDHGLPRSSAEWLRQAGINTVHVGELGFSAAEDAAILQLGRDQNRAVVTLDADFHTLLASSGASSPSFIRIRIEGLSAEDLANL